VTAASRVGAAFARQMIMPGWEQARVARARVLIAGVGALGNACAETLALTGVGRLALADFDAIETSNLSRTVLFRRGDEGRRKAAVAAERLRPLMLARDPVVVPLDVDVAWDLGWGVYRRLDLVLGCVDSAEARARVGMPARALGVPAVFGGLYAHDGTVTVQGVRGGTCVACSFSAKEWAEWSRRYSCDDVRLALAAEARIPATQVIAGLVGASMTGVGLSLLHGDSGPLDTRLFLAAPRPGQPPAISPSVRVTEQVRCPFHCRIEDVQEDPALSSHMPVGELLERLASWGSPVTVRLGREFLLTCRCKGCGSRRRVWKPRHRATTGDLVCAACRMNGVPLDGDAEIEGITELSPETDAGLLALPLDALGIPALHLLEVAGARRRGWVELTADLPQALPGWPAASGGPVLASALQ
jgi:molybdopterin/thiamine biosynthesis adenylyltransferase